MFPAPATQAGQHIQAARPIRAGPHPGPNPPARRGMIPKRDITERKTIRPMNAAAQIAIGVRRGTGFRSFSKYVTPTQPIGLPGAHAEIVR